MANRWNQQCRCGSKMTRIAHSSDYTIEVYLCDGDCLAWIAVLFVPGDTVPWFHDPNAATGR